MGNEVEGVEEAVRNAGDVDHDAPGTPSVVVSADGSTVRRSESVIVHFCVEVAVSCPEPPPSPGSVVLIPQMLASQSPLSKRTLNFLNPDSVVVEDQAGGLNIENAGEQVSS